LGAEQGFSFVVENVVFGEPEITRRIFQHTRNIFGFIKYGRDGLIFFRRVKKNNSRSNGPGCYK
jgi:hypothetical protein